MRRVLPSAVVCAAVYTAPVAAWAAAQTTTVVQAQTQVQAPMPAPVVVTSTSETVPERPWAGPMSQLIWLDANMGVESVQLQTFSVDFNSFSAGFLPTSGVGPTVRAGAGLRFGFLTLGVRGRMASFDDGATVGPWQIWTLDGEVGIRVPLYRIEPHIVFAAGYSSFGGFGAAVSGLQDGLDVHGLDARLGAGLDYWLTQAISIGADLDGELLAIARPGISVRDLAVAQQVGTLDQAKARILEANGSSVGSALALTLGVGLHF